MTTMTPFKRHIIASLSDFTASVTGSKCPPSPSNSVSTMACSTPSEVETSPIISTDHSAMFMSSATSSAIHHVWEDDLSTSDATEEEEAVQDTHQFNENELLKIELLKLKLSHNQLTRELRMEKAQNEILRKEIHDIHKESFVHEDELARLQELIAEVSLSLELSKDDNRRLQCELNKIKSQQTNTAGDANVKCKCEATNDDASDAEQVKILSELLLQAQDEKVRLEQRVEQLELYIHSIAITTRQSASASRPATNPRCKEAAASSNIMIMENQGSRNPRDIDCVAPL
eukprot:GILK01006551.1.p1 GENE.GILK01006551.1~~GILK01006551.1.p1  ORF type:complete len:288 (+),score=46.03 GILK01006551.1:85-948(+)